MPVTRVDALGAELAARMRQRDFCVGDMLAGRYEIVDRLGEGAMGQVFVAVNQAIGKRVAIKVLKPELLIDDVFRKRFQQEAEALASIEHPNVARFLDLVVGDPTFLVMEYVEGTPLDGVLEKEVRLPAARATRIACRLGYALAAADRAGIVHRDLKPSNIVLTVDPETGEQPKLIDFGIAKRKTSAHTAALTQAGQIVGTPSYMSPEQIGDGAVDARSDVYSLGCVLYEMVAGAPPFVARGAPVQLLYKHMHETPQRLGAVADGVTPVLDAIIARALAKKPGDRFQSTGEMAEALAEVHRDDGFGGTRTSATRPRPALEHEQPGSRRWLAYGLVLALVFAAGFVVRRGVRPRVDPSPANDTLLVVTTRPAGASLAIDGKPVDETTPTALRGLPAGAHRVTFRLADRADAEREVNLEAAEREVLDVTLAPLTRTLGVRSQPTGATVFLDGQLIPGETPLTVQVMPDDFHQLQIEKLGYETETLKVAPDEKHGDVEALLRPETRTSGTVFVDASFEAGVWIDDVATLFSVPTVGIRTSAGEHTVELRDESGARQATRRIAIRQGETLHLMITKPDLPPGSQPCPKEQQ